MTPATPTTQGGVPGARSAASTSLPCPHCHSVAVYSIPGLSTEQETWLHDLQATILGDYPRLRALRHAPLDGLQFVTRVEAQRIVG